LGPTFKSILLHDLQQAKDAPMSALNAGCMSSDNVSGSGRAASSSGQPHHALLNVAINVIPSHDEPSLWSKDHLAFNFAEGGVSPSLGGHNSPVVGPKPINADHSEGGPNYDLGASFLPHIVSSQLCCSMAGTDFVAQSTPGQSPSLHSGPKVTQGQGQTQSWANIVDNSQSHMPTKLKYIP